MPQANADQKGIAEGLKNRVQQSAAIAAMRDEEEHPSSAPTPSPYASTPQDKVAHQHPVPKGEKATYQQAQDILKKTLTPKVYDKGGKVNVHDGKHEIAILKDGERVLTPEQNKDWEHAKNLGGVDGKAPTTLPIGGKTVRDSNDVTPDMTKSHVYDKGGKVEVMSEEHSPSEKAHFSRAMHKLHGGALHRHFGIPEDQPIPMAKKEEAANSSNPHVAAMGRMAKAMAGWKH